MTRAQKFYYWWNNVVKGDIISNESLETIIIECEKIEENENSNF